MCLQSTRLEVSLQKKQNFQKNFFFLVFPKFLDLQFHCYTYEISPSEVALQTYTVAWGERELWLRIEWELVCVCVHMCMHVNTKKFWYFSNLYI